MKRLVGAVVLAAGLGAALAARRAAVTAVPSAGERVVQVTAKRFEYSPREIRLQRGVPVVLEITALDRRHGFKVPALGVRADVEPGRPARVRVVPDRAGTFTFRCDVFCGDGHDEMEGTIVVE